ncbi:MAG: hypothetical protein ABIH41_06425 [Nanoarchaeota archaeon]
MGVVGIGQREWLVVALVAVMFCASFALSEPDKIRLLKEQVREYSQKLNQSTAMYLEHLDDTEARDTFIVMFKADLDGDTLENFKVDTKGGSRIAKIERMAADVGDFIDDPAVEFIERD